MGQLFHRDAWDFMDELANRYEPVSMIHDLFGVSSRLRSRYFG